MSETISRPFTFVKEGIFYFSRRVPNELKSHYTSPRIAFSLRTKSPKIAEARARKVADQLDEYWYHLRCQDVQMPGKHMLRQQGSIPAQPNIQAPDVSFSSVLLSEAVSVYLGLKGKGRSITFHRAAERSCGYVIDTCGDKHLEAYTRADANAFRDALIARGLSGSSITWVFGTVREVINFAASEQGLTLNNPFTGVYYDRNAGVSERTPFVQEAIASVQARSQEVDDDLRWLVALVSDTGMRLAEAAGLAREDILQDDEKSLFARVRPLV